MDSSCVEKYAESGFGRLQPPAIPPKPGFERLQPEQFLQNPVLGDCSPNNSSKTLFWAIAAQTIPPKPGFGQLQHSCVLQLIRICGNPPPPLWPTRCGAVLGGRGGKEDEEDINNQSGHRSFEAFELHIERDRSHLRNQSRAALYDEEFTLIARFVWLLSLQHRHHVGAGGATLALDAQAQ